MPFLFIFLTISSSLKWKNQNMIALFSSPFCAANLLGDITKSQFNSQFTIVSDKRYLSNKDKKMLSTKYRYNFDSFQLKYIEDTQISLFFYKRNSNNENTVYISKEVPDIQTFSFLLASNGYQISNSTDSQFLVTLHNDATNFSLHPSFLPDKINLYYFSDSILPLKHSDFSFSFFAICLFQIFFIIFILRLKYVSTKLSVSDYWFVTTNGSLLSRPTSLYFTLIRNFMPNFKELAKTENAINFVDATESVTYRFKFIRVCNYAYLALYHPEEMMDETLPNLEMTGGIYRSYDQAAPEAIICRTTADAKKSIRQFMVDMNIYGEQCRFTCTPKHRHISFGHHCLHAQYIHRIYIGVLLDLLQSDNDNQMEKIVESIIDRLDFSGCGFFSVNDGQIETLILKSKDSDSEDALKTYSSRICGSSGTIEFVKQNIGRYEVYGHRVKIGKMEFIQCACFPRHLLPIRASEQQFLGFFAVAMSFHQLMTKQFDKVERFINLFNHSNDMTLYEFKKGKVFHVYGKDKFHPKTCNLTGFQTDDHDKWYLTKNYTSFDEVYDCDISLLFVESVESYFKDFFSLSDQMTYEVKLAKSFNMEFCTSSNLTHISKSLGYQTPQRLFNLVHPHDRKLLKAKRDFIDAPIRLQNANGDYQYFIVPIVHSHSFAFIDFSAFSSILKYLDLPDNRIPLQTESENFIFWCVDPLTDRLIATIGSPSIISQVQSNESYQIMDLIHESDRETFANSIDTLLSTQNSSVQHIIKFVINGENRYFNVEITLTAGYLLTILAHDVTEHKRILDSAAETNQLIDMGLLYSNVLIWFFDDNHNESLVYSAMPIAHKPFYMNWSTIEFNIVLEDQAKLTEQLRAVLDGTSNSVDIEIQVYFDKIRCYMMRGMKTNKKGQLTGILVDTTELKSLSDQAEQQKHRAEEANSAKSRFLANMSHEIRTPLSGMSGLLEILEGTSLQPDALDIVNCIRSSFTKLLELLNDTLDLAKMDQKKMLPQTISFVTFDTLIPVISNFRKRSFANNIELNVLVSPSLPVILLGDPYFLAQITTNLIANAFKYTDSGSILVSFSYDNDQFVIEVQDTGVGFLPEEEKVIYEAFPVIESTSERPPRGIGACLALVKRMVNSLNVTIDYHTAMNKGTTFRITLPFPSLMSPYVLPTIKSKRLQIVNLCPQRFIKDSFKSCFVDFFGFQVINGNEPLKMNKKRLMFVVCDEETLETAKSIQHHYESINILLVPLRPLEIKDDNITVFSLPTFWLKINHYIFSKVLHSHQSSQKVPIPNLTILVAEDDPPIQIILKKLLERTKKKFVVVSDGTEVLDALNSSQDRFNIIFMDHQMPKMNGPEAARTIRESDKWYKDIPIIAMTASKDQEDKDICIQAGMNHFISKPITFDKIVKEMIYAAELPFNTNH